MKKIAIIGCGNGGKALAGHLSLMGHDVRLYADFKHPGSTFSVQACSGIELMGKVTGFVQINVVSTNLEECIQDAEIIFMALPALACEKVFSEMLSFLHSGQIIINTAGYFSAIFEHQILMASKLKIDLIFAELTSFPYACRSIVENRVNIIAIKEFVGIATIPANKTQELINELASCFPCGLRAKSSIIEVGLYNTSGIGHTPVVLFNAARIGNQDEFYFYKDGISEETAQVMQKLDAERINIGKILGYKIPTHYQVLNDYYGYNYDSIFDYFKNSAIHNSIKFFPTSTRTRYILEDVPFILVPWYTLAKSLGVNAEGISLVINFISLLHDTDYMTLGRKFTLDIIEQYK